MTEHNHSTRPARKQVGPVTVAIRAIRAPEPIPAPANPERPPQTIRGGYLIVRRNDDTGRLRKVADKPYEHGSLDEAKAQAAALAERLGGEFSVFEQVATILPPVVLEASPEPMPAEGRPVLVERRMRRAAVRGGQA